MRISDWSSDVCSSDLALRLSQTSKVGCEHSKTLQRPPELLHSITCKGSPMEDFIDNLAAQEGWPDSTTQTVLAGGLADLVAIGGVKQEDLEELVLNRGAIAAARIGSQPCRERVG